MSKRIFLVVAAFAAVVLAGCMDEGNDDDTVVVQMVDGTAQGFDPVELTIEAGTTVMWHNVDNQVHNAVPDDPEAEWGMPSGELISGGERFSYTFDEPGTYNYHCEPHASVNDDGECTGMCATIIVEAAAEAE